MKTVCMTEGCGATWGHSAPGEPISHGLCRPCGEKELAKVRAVAAADRPACGAELRRTVPSTGSVQILDTCRRGRHSTGPHEGACGKWWSHEGGGTTILPTRPISGRVAP